MVTDARATVRAGSLKFLNAPKAIHLRLNETGEPVAADMATPAKTNRLRRSSKGPVWVKVRSVDDVWKVGPDEWWRGPANVIERMYYELRFEDGRRLTVFRDMVSGSWFRQEDV